MLKATRLVYHSSTTKTMPTVEGSTPSDASTEHLAKLSLKGEAETAPPSPINDDDHCDDELFAPEKKARGKTNNDGSNTGAKESSSTAFPAPSLPPTNTKMLHRSSSNSSSFIRAHDLEAVPKYQHQGGRNVSSTKLHESMKATGGRFANVPVTATQGLFFLDDDLKLILDSLVQLGLEEATDESARFVPGRETARVLRERQMTGTRVPVDPQWTFPNWQAATLRNINEILVWNGTCRAAVNNGFGSDWPIVKSRGIIPTSPRNLAAYLWDSKNVSKYNSMSLGRDDGTIFQEGLDTLAADSPYGIPGCAKILKSYNKVKLVPRTVEIISLLHLRPLEPPLAPKGTYLMVSRSLWESDNLSEEAALNFEPPAHLAESNKKTASSTFMSRNPFNRSNSSNNDDDDDEGSNNIIRTEMFLSVQLLRPMGDKGQYCEMTSIAHALAPGLNKTVAKTAAGVTAVKIIRDLQTLLRK